MTTPVSDEVKVEEKRYTGRITRVSAKGYGFISCIEIPFTRIFFHWSALRPDTLNFKDVQAGMEVSFVAFELEGKGYRAIKIKVENAKLRKAE